MKCKAVVINLDKSPDRLHNFITAFKKNTDLANKIPLFRFRAYDSNKLNIKDHIDFSQYVRVLHTDLFDERYYHKDFTKNAIGCFLSHIDIYKCLIEDPDADYYIIFEDDAYPTTKNIQSIILNIIESQDSHSWDIYLLGGYIFESAYCNIHLCNQVYYFWGTYAYIISKQAAKKILKHIYPIDMQIDSKLSKMSKQNIISIHSIQVPIFIQSSKTSSTIQHAKIKHSAYINPFIL